MIYVHEKTGIRFSFEITAHGPSFEIIGEKLMLRKFTTMTELELYIAGRMDAKELVK